jgi:hypothetical protein
MRKVLILITILLLTIVFSSQVLAVEAGGELEISMTGVWQDDGSFSSELSEVLNLKLFLPQIANNEIQYAFRVAKPLQNILADEGVAYFTKKLYLKHRFDNIHVTLGRQPVSWSFGSLLNPVDYTLGAVAMEGDSNSKYTDALAAYVPINWNSSLTAVSSFPTGFSNDPKKMKWGVRGRTGVEGYDVTLNYVKEPDVNQQSVANTNQQITDNPFNNISSLIPNQRLGLTIKGDLGI